MFAWIVPDNYLCFQEENQALSTTDQYEQNNHVQNTITTTNWVILLKRKRFQASILCLAVLLQIHCSNLQSWREICNSTKCLICREFTLWLGRKDGTDHFWCPDQISDSSYWFCTTLLVLLPTWDNILPRMDCGPPGCSWDFIPPPSSPALLSTTHTWTSTTYKSPAL